MSEEPEAYKVAREVLLSVFSGDKKTSDKVQAKVAEVTNGTTVIYVTDDGLAAALSAVDIPFIKPIIVRRKLASGVSSDQWLFSAKSTDGSFSTKDLIKAWNKWEEFISKNPTHPFTFAICTAKNMVRCKQIKECKQPFVSFRHPDGKSIFHVPENSKRHKEYLMHGLTQL